MIGKIYAYIDEQLKAVDSKLALVDDPFLEGELGDDKPHCKYKVNIQNIETIKQANFFERRAPVQIELYRKAFTDITEDLIKLMDKAILIDNELIVPQNFCPAGFTNVEPSGITPAQIDQNLRILTVTINLAFVVEYGC